MIYGDVLLRRWDTRIYEGMNKEMGYYIKASEIYLFMYASLLQFVLWRVFGL